MENNNIAVTNGTNGTEKTGLQKALDHVQRGWTRFSTSKGGRWAIRGTKALIIGLGIKTAYDAGKKSVKPEVIMVTPVEQEPAEETKPEEEEPVVNEETTSD